MTLARIGRGAVLRVSMSDGTSVTVTLVAGDTMEALDPLAARALQEQISAGELTTVTVRPSRIDVDIDSKPREPRPTATTERTR